jgi:phage gpG-like protein
VPLTGDFAALARLVHQMRAVGGPEFKRQAGDLLAATALKQLADGFRAERDPYSKPWKPLKHREGKILRDTGRLANSYQAHGTERGFVISTNVVYAPPHQFGARLKSGAKASLPSSGGKGGRLGRRKATLGRRAKSLKARASKTHTLPRRQMIPAPDTGGIGPLWGPALNKEADLIMREQLK